MKTPKPEEKRYMSKLMRKDKPLAQLTEMRKLFKLKGVAELCGISYSALRRMTEDGRSENCTVQTGAAIDEFHRAYKDLLKRGKFIRKKITYFATRKNSAWGKGR